MPYRVVWSPRAVEDLEAIAQYIAADSEAYSAALMSYCPLRISCLKTLAHVLNDIQVILDS